MFDKAMARPKVGAGELIAVFTVREAPVPADFEAAFLTWQADLSLLNSDRSLDKPNGYLTHVERGRKPGRPECLKAEAIHGLVSILGTPILAP